MTANSRELGQFRQQKMAFSTEDRTKVVTVTCVVSLVDERRGDSGGGALGNTEREVERDTVEGKETEHIR